MFSATVLIVLVAILVVSHSKLQNFFSVETKLNGLQYIKNLISVYQDFYFVFHIENETLNEGNILIRHLENVLNKSLIIFNYDEKDSALSRPYGIRFVNIVLLSDISRFSKYSNKPLNIILYDVVIFILLNFRFDWKKSEQQTRQLHKWDVSDSGLPFRQLLDLKYAGRVIFITTAENATVSVYNKCYYCGKQERYLKLQEETTAFQMNISIKEVMPSTFDNLQGYFFTVSYLDYFPFMFCKRVKEKIVKQERVKVCTKSRGSEALLLKSLSKSLNFKYKLLPEGNIFNTSYTAIFNKVRDKKIDFAIGGITLTKYRSTKATFTNSLRFEDYTLLYVYRQPVWEHFFVLLYPFGIQLWISFVISIFLVSVSLYFFMRFSNYYFKTNYSSASECMFVSN